MQHDVDEYDDDDVADDDDLAVEVLPHSHQLLCVTKAMSGASLSSHTTAMQCTPLYYNALCSDTLRGTEVYPSVL